MITMILKEITVINTLLKQRSISRKDEL